jgi:putative intracellular protease/amidase
MAERLTGRRVAVLVKEGLEDLEFWATVMPLREECASAATLRGSRAVGSTGMKDDLESTGATWVDEPTFRDGSLVRG